MTDYVASYYAATAKGAEPFPSLAGPVSCDVCIIGGGFTGLSSALFLTEAGYDVVLLEAARIGWGASGRNGGQVVNSYSRDIDVIEKRYDQTTAGILGGMMFEGAEIIRRRIDQYAIDCDYRPGGIFAALNAKQFQALKRRQQNWQRYGHQQLTLLDRGEIRREIGSKRYYGGLLDPLAGHLHPLNLALGEAGAITRHGGRIFEQSAAANIRFGHPTVISTANGQVSARFTLVAGNAYLNSALAPSLASRSMPCGSQIIVTEPLPMATAQALLPHNYCVEDGNYLLDYFRLTADNRLLYGGGVNYGGRAPENIDSLIMPKLLKTFPQLNNTRIDYRWSGNFLLTLSRMPQFGRLRDTVYFMQGYSGHGVACSHLAGKLLAEVLRGDAERFDAFARLPHLPLVGGRRLQVPLTLLGAAYYTLRDRLGV